MKPVLLLIPGMFNTVQIWHPVAELLKAEADVHIVDVLSQDSIRAMADDAWQMLADVAPGTPRLVAGFSMGGYVAIELLAAHAAEIDGVAFVDTSARTETAQSTVVREKTIGALERNFAKAVEGVLLYSLHPSNLANAELVDGTRRMMQAVGAEAAIRQTRAITARADHRAMLAQLHMPALVVCGREDKVTPPELSRDLADLVPGARLEWIESAGHQTPAEQPAELAQLLRSLLRSVAP